MFGSRDVLREDPRETLRLTNNRSGVKVGYLQTPFGFLETVLRYFIHDFGRSTTSSVTVNTVV